MSILSNPDPPSREFTRTRMIDRVLALKMHSLTQNLKKVSQTKQVLEDSFHQSRYTYAELQKMHNSLFHKYKTALLQIQKLQSQAAHEFQCRELLQKQNDQLYSYFSDNGLHLTDVEQSISALKDVKEKYEVERSNSLREQQINKELVKIVEECLQRIESYAELSHHSRGRYQPQTNSDWQMAHRMRGFLQFITHNREQLMTVSRRTHREYPQGDSVNQIPSPEEYHFQVIDPKQLMLPQLRENTAKDDEAYLREKYSNPYVSELLGRISERSREELSDRSMISSSKRKSQIKWQEASQVKNYDISDIRSEEYGRKSQTTLKRDSLDKEYLNADSLHTDSLHKTSINRDSLKSENPSRTRVQSSPQQPTPQHLFQTLSSIQKKFGQLQQESADSKSQNRMEKHQLAEEIKQLEQIVIRSREDILEMESEMHEQTTLMNKIKQELYIKNSQVESLEIRLKSKESDIHELKKELELEIQDLKKELELEIHNYRNELELERESNKELKSQIQQMETSINQDEKIIHNLKEQVTKLRATNEQISKQLIGISKVYEISQARFVLAEKEWSEKVESWKIVALENETHNKELKSEFLLIKSDFQSAKRQLESSISKVNQMKTEKQQAEQQKTTLQNNYISLQQKNTLISVQINRVREQCSQLESRMKTAQTNNQSIKRSNLQLSSKADELERQITKMRCERSKMQQLMFKMQQQKKTLAQQVGRLKQQQREGQLQMGSSSYSSSNDSFHSIRSIPDEHLQVEEAGGQYGMGQTEAEESQRHYSMLINQKDSQIGMLKGQVESLRRLVQQLEEKISDRNKVIEQHDFGSRQKTHKQQQSRQWIQIAQVKPQLNPTFDQNKPNQSQCLQQPLDEFEVYKREKDQQVRRLHQIISEKIEMFENKVVEEEKYNQSQILKLSQTISQLQTQNDLLLQELTRTHRQLYQTQERLNFHKQTSELLKSEIQKINAQMINAPYNQKSSLPPYSYSHQQQMSAQKISILQESLNQKQAQNQSLTSTLQKLKLQLQTTTTHYQTTLQTLQSTQLQSQQHNVQDIEHHYQSQCHRIQQSYQNDLTSLQTQYHSLQTQYHSLQRLHHHQQSEFTSQLQSLKQTHAHSIATLSKSAHQKVSSLKQINKKTHTKLAQHENKIISLQHNLGQFSHLLTEKDLLLQDLAHQIHLKDQQIHNLLTQPQINPIHTIKSSQLESELHQQIHSLQSQLLSAQQTHSKNQTTLSKLIDELRNENSTLKKQNQDLSKALQRESTVNSEKLRFISVEIKKQKLKIHTLTTSFKLVPEILWRNRIQNQLTSTDSPINQFKEQFFRAKKTDPMAELSKLQKKYSREKHPKPEQGLNSAKQVTVCKLPRPHSQLPPNYEGPQRPQHLREEREGQYFQPILMKSSRQRLEKAIYDHRRVASNLLERQYDAKEHAGRNLIFVDQSPKEAKQEFNRLGMQRQSHEFIPHKDTHLVKAQDFIMIGNTKSQNSQNDFFYDFTDTPKCRLRPSTSLEVVNHQQNEQFLNRKDSVNSQNSYSSQPQLGQGFKNHFDETQTVEKQEVKRQNIKRSMEMKILEETIMRKKQQNMALLKQIRQRNTKNH